MVTANKKKTDHEVLHDANKRMFEMALKAADSAGSVEAKMAALIPVICVLAADYIDG